MRAFVIFGGALLAVVLAWLLVPSLLGAGGDPAHQARLIGAIQTVEARLETASPAASKVDAFIYPEISADESSENLWRLTGIASFTFGGQRGSLPYEASLETLCPDYRRSECWDLARVSLEGEPLEDDLVVSPSLESLQAVEAFETSGDGLGPTLILELRDPAADIALAQSVLEESASSESATADTLSGVPTLPPVETPGTTSTAPEAGPSGGTPLPSEASQSAALPAPVAPDAPAAQTTAAQVPQDFDTELTGSDAVARAQLLLSERGLYRGTVDGLMGARTRAAISSFQESRGLRPDGRLTAGLIVELESATSP